MKKTIAMLCTVLFAALGAFADTWTDPETGIEWTYTVSDGRASVGSGDYYGARAVPTSTTGAITIPATLGGRPVTGIGEYAFENCSALTSVTIPSSVTSIGYEAFEGCSALTSVTIPNSVTSIDGYAFYDCTALASVTIPSSVKSVGAWAFFNTPFYDNLPDGMVILGSALYEYRGECTDEVVIPFGVTSIGVNAFYGCSAMPSVKIPGSVASIDECAFKYCSGLKSVVIPGSVTSIGECAFEYCSGLKSVTISEGVTSIGYEAFLGCSALTSVTIPSSVTSIDDRTFEDCSDLKTVYVDAGDKERVKKMIENSGSGLSGVEYVVMTGYVVKFEAGDGAGAMSDMMCEPGKVYKLTKNAFTCDGKRFAGWRGSNGRRYDDEMMVYDLGKVGEVLTLTAIWE